jgi:CSLREA domain-containing protein
MSIASPTIAELRKHPGIRRKIMAARITVNSTDDSDIRDAVLTLREAILVANGTLNVPADLTVAEQAQIKGTVGTAADRDTIAFNIGAIGSQQLIQPLSAQPPISDPAIVDGWSQGGAGYNGLPLVEQGRQPRRIGDDRT